MLSEYALLVLVLVCWFLLDFIVLIVFFQIQINCSIRWKRMISVQPRWSMDSNRTKMWKCVIALEALD